MDISFQVINLGCPVCQFTFEVLLKQIINEELIVCPGCLSEIQLVDEGGEINRAQQEMEEVIDGLRKFTKGFGR